MNTFKTACTILLVTTSLYAKSTYSINATQKEYENIIFSLSVNKYANDFHYSMNVKFNKKNNYYHIKFIGNKLFLKEIQNNLKNYREILKKIPPIKPINSFKHIKKREDLKQYIMSSDINNIKKTISKLKHINFQYKNSYTPIYYAISSGNIKIVQLLIKSGSDINFVNIENITPLHHAVKYGDIDIIDLILSQGAIINSQDAQGKTPLHYAAERNYQEIIYYLIGKGANKHITDFGGETPRF